MAGNNSIMCPICNDTHLILKYQATYEYSYTIDSNAPGVNNIEELLPYMYDKREQKDAKQYVECNNCKAKYPCYFDKWTQGVSSKTLQQAIDSAYNSEQQLNKE